MPDPIDALRAIDSNVVLRYLLQDHPEYSARASTLIDSVRPLGITPVTLAEIAWTLAGPRYRRERAAVAHALIAFLARENIVSVGFDKAEAQAALLAYAPTTEAVDFGDALIAACARSAGIDEIYSFDRRFGRAGMIAILPPHISGQTA